MYSVCWQLKYFKIADTFPCKYFYVLHKLIIFKKFIPLKRKTEYCLKFWKHLSIWLKFPWDISPVVLSRVQSAATKRLRNCRISPNMSRIIFITLAAFVFNKHLQNQQIALSLHVEQELVYININLQQRDLNFETSFWW